LTASKYGAIYVFSDGALSLKNCRFENLDSGSGSASGVTAYESSIDINGLSSFHNMTTGAIQSTTGRAISVANTNFTNCTAEYGGAISSVDAETLTIADSFFSQNTATVAGGAVSILDKVLNTVVNLTNNVFEGNSATESNADAGALFVNT
jgi:hypothetical protein